MSTSKSVQRAVRLALMTSAAATAVISLPAWSADDTITEVIVTGSRIAQPNLTTTSPVTSVTASDIQTQGVTRIEDMLTQLPQAFTTQNATTVNGSTGTATVDLRGLGSSRTLVLIDGRRMPYGGVTGDSAAPNLNMIPTPLVERVEVLTGGSSAVYGSDAVSGVVNFIMKKDFEGVQIDGQYGVYQHENDFGGPGSPKLRQVIATRAATNPSQYALPGKSGTDGDSRQGSIIMGVNSEDGRGNITAYVVYAQNDAVLQANRDFSACTLSPAPTTQFACGGSGTNATGQFQADTGTFTVAGNTFRTYSTANDAYNFGPLNYFVRPDERYSLGATGHYELSEHADVYTQLMFTDDRSVAQIAPGGLFIGDTSTLNCDNPLMTLQQRTQIGCTPGLIASGGTVPVAIGRRNVEGGGRQQDFHNNTFRGVLGVKGDIVTGWQYDASMQFSRTSVEQLTLNYFAKDRIVKALDAVADPDHPGQVICRSVLDGTDPNCVPYNVFSAGGVTQAALGYVQAPGVQQGVIDQSVFVGAITGDLGTIGMKLPSATEPFQVAVGVEQRRDKLENTTDALQQNDLLSGAGGATIGIKGTTHVNDYFAELVAPLVQDKPFAQQLGLDLAYRYSDYGAITTDTYKLSADWAPIQDVRLRASYQRAVRAPNIVELFTGHGLNLFDLDAGDPCGLATPSPATRQQCLDTGVPASVYDNATDTGRGRLDNNAGQYSRLQGGVTDLKPETSDTYSYGIVFTPSFAPGLSVTIDYFDIKIDDTISTHGGVNTLNACYFNNDAAACSRIHRTATGSLYQGDGNVEDLNVNIGSLETKGVDLSVAYTGVDIGGAGSLSFSLAGTFVDTLHVEPGPNIDGYDCKGKFGGRCEVPNGIPTPEWRHTARIGWTTPFNVDLSLAWRYIGKTEQLDAPAGRLDSKFDAENYFDIYGSWAMLDNTTFRLGVNNILDNDPQLNSNVGTTGNGNTYPQVYDSLGRFIFTGLNVKF